MATVSLQVVDRKISGVTLYDGPSLIDGKRIIAVATGLGHKTGNEKTGDMVQVWILVADTSPIEANREGLDASVCGNCKHRHFRSCYVNLARGPLQVHQGFVEGKYPKVKMNQQTAELFRDRYVRLGAFGDPTAVPSDVWETVTRVCAGWTGYTHQWKRARAKAYRQWLMASCDTLEEANKAKEKGWKPFYVRQEGDELPKGYFVCPASEEAGKRLTCAECRACHGGEWNGKQGVPSIIAHGVSWKKVYFRKGMKLMAWKEKYVGVFAKKD